MNQAVKVGIFMTAALAVLAYMILEVEDLQLFGDQGTHVEAAFDTVAGLDDKASVRVAGVRVGRVDGIRLEDQQAIVTLLLEQPVELSDDAAAAIANLGLLGDKFVLLDPGTPGGPPLAVGTRLPGTAPVSFDDAMAKVNELGDSIQSALGSLSGDAEGSTIGRLLDNLDAASLEIRGLIADNRAQIASTVGNFDSFSRTLSEELPTLTAQIERILTQVEEVVAENRSNLKDSLETISQTAGGLRTSIDNLNTISTKIAAGEGTIGKLVNDEEAHDQLVATLGKIESGVETLGDTFGRIQRLELEVGFDSYYLEGIDDSRTAFNLQLRPGGENERKFYNLGFVDDPRGRTRIQTETRTTIRDDGSMETEIVRQVRNEEKISISAQFGLRLGEASLRAGLFESTGGLGLDYALFDRRLIFSVEAYDFNRDLDEDPHLRFLTEWRVNRNVYLLGGYDDPLLEDGDSIFLGAGLRWRDDDLKYLLGSAPRF